MRLLLVNPKSKALDALPIPPLGILYLAAYVRDIAEVRVLDDNKERLPLHLVVEQIKWADIVGITGTTSQFGNACEIANIARHYDKKTIYGGPHASALPEESRRHMDIVVCGEGEQALRHILLWDTSPGILEFSFIKDLAILPSPARDLVPIMDYPIRELKRFDGAYTHMMTGRGCNSSCIFCSSPWMWKYPRLMSAGRILREMMEIYETYGIRNIHFQDDTFTLSRERTIRLCLLIAASGINFKWSCQTRPDMVDEALLQYMSLAGCVQIEFGVESGSSKLLKTARKEYSKSEIKKAFDSARKAGITTYGFFIVGLPGETIWTWLQSIFFAWRLKMDSCVWTVLMPYPGTQVSRMVKVLDHDYSNWLYKRPIIKVGYLGPKILTVMRNIADILTNGFSNKGTYRREKPKNES